MAARAMKTPKNVTYERICEPDMERMVRALKIVLALPDKPKTKGDRNDGNEDSRICGYE